MDWVMAIVTILVSGTGGAVVTNLFNRRARHAEARLKNAEADQKELDNKRTEVDHYREVINDLVSDMKALRLDQDATDQRYRENTAGLHTKLDTANEALVKANETIDRLETEGKRGSEETKALTTGLKRANEALDEAKKEIGELRQEVKDGNAIIAELREEVSQLRVERAEKK